jgi:hypothetical protein
MSVFPAMIALSASLIVTFSTPWVMSEKASFM